MAADFSWTPPLVVLALGAVAGAVVVAARARRQAAHEAPTVSSRGSDLQRRYDALIRRLAEGASPEERAAIEIEAATVLREMETGKAPGSSPTASRKAAAEPTETAPAAPPTPARPASAWAGFAYGVLTMGVLGGLFYLASQGSTERSEGGSPTGGTGMGSAAGAPQTSAADDANLKALEEAVRKSPTDIAQRIELVRAYLQRRDLMQVFDQTKAVLEIEPGNPYALTYQALVRVAMGQAPQAETMLVEVIKKNPGIEDAYIHLAIARLQLGNKKGAEEAIQAGQKQFPEDKEQLAQVFAQISAPSAEGGAEVPAEHPEVPPPAMGEGSGAAPAPSSAQLVVVVDLPRGVTVPAGAILFVIVREAGLESGPPSAVKRVPATNFPITVTISEKDSMAGEGLPGLVRIDARVDRDGDPLSKDPQDPAATEENVRPGGSQVLMVLTPGKR
ncbi:MAG TPA: tetratricopeptide repeat protein [Vicinamibacteria bacterium]|nr:tetratricopeptide repeat protein [Vicinamibacteria bacterium]